MARPLWSELKPATKKRKLAYYKKHHGLSAGQVAARYNAGSLGPQTATRGHAKTPERPSRATAEKYPEYVRKREPSKGGQKGGQTERERWRDRAYLNIDRKLGHYIKYNRTTVRANVYGGITAESGAVPGMTTEMAKATAGMSELELTENAYPQYKGNPWWYH